MNISGFTLVRNGSKFDYPYLESVRSLLPAVDELIINVGKGEDETLSQVRKFAEEEGQGRVKYFESSWPLENPRKKQGGLILSEQTNLALERCSGDWCIYLQADEVVHESDLPILQSALVAAHSDLRVEGLLFDYLHFYGSYGVIQQTRSSYRREVRAIRRNSGAKSAGDAQSFRKADGTKLKVLSSGARIFHYGWVRSPDAMREKTFFMDQLYHGAANPEVGSLPFTGQNYRYKRIWGLRKFEGSHPSVMSERIEKKGWNWDLKASPLEWSWIDIFKVILDSFEHLTGLRLFEYRSYREVR